MDIEAIDRAYTACGKDGGELLHFTRRRCHEHYVCIDAFQTIIVVKNTCQLHIRSGVNGFFGGFADVTITKDCYANFRF